ESSTTASQDLGRSYASVVRGEREDPLMTELFTESRRTALRALCDTVVPCVERDDDDGFWARTASDQGVDRALEGLIAGLPAEQHAGLVGLLDALDGLGIAQAPSQATREEILRSLSLASSAAAAGIGALASLTAMLHYGAPDPAAGPWSTGRTACARRPGCASAGRASSASRGSTGPSSTGSRTPSSSGSARPTRRPT